MKWKNEFNFSKLNFTVKIYVLNLKVKISKLHKNLPETLFLRKKFSKEGLKK